MERNPTHDLTRVAEIELVYRPLISPEALPKVTNPEQARSLFIRYWDMDKIHLIEQFKVMLLNINCGVMGICQLSSGGTTSTVVDLRLLFSMALKAGAQAILLAHNHPSGNLSPSEQDIKLTEKIKRAAGLFDITLQDHLIITSQGYYSFTNEGAI